MKATQSCPVLCYLMDSSPSGSSVHGIIKAGILEGVGIPFSRGSSQPRDGTQISHIAGGFFTSEAPEGRGGRIIKINIIKIPYMLLKYILGLKITLFYYVIFGVQFCKTTFTHNFKKFRWHPINYKVKRKLFRLRLKVVCNLGHLFHLRLPLPFNMDCFPST